MAIRGATPLAPKRSHRLKKTLLSTSLLALITISMMTLFAVNKVLLKNVIKKKSNYTELYQEHNSLSSLKL